MNTIAAAINASAIRNAANISMYTFVEIGRAFVFDGRLISGNSDIALTAAEKYRAIVAMKTSTLTLPFSLSMGEIKKVKRR